MGSLVQSLAVLFWVTAVQPAPAPAAANPAEADPQSPPARGAAAPAVPAAPYRSLVVAKREPEDPFRSNRSVSAIDRTALAEQSPRTLPEALRDTPGVFSQTTSTGAGSPIIRGMVGPQVLIVVDGVRLNNSVYRTGPVQYLNLVDPLQLERVEILRGPGSVQYGSDAMGGVIQVTPLQPPDARELPGIAGFGNAAARGSSSDWGRVAHADVGLGFGGLGALAGASWKDFGLLTGGSGVGEQPYSDHGQRSALGTVSHRFQQGPLERWQLSASYLMSQIVRAGRTDSLWDKKSLRVYDNDDHLAYARLKGRIVPLATDAAVIFSYQHFFERRDTLQMADDLVRPLSTVRDDVTARTFGADLNLTSRLLEGRVPLRYGALWYHDAVSSSRSSYLPGGAWKVLSQQDYPDASTYDTWSVYGMAEGDPVSKDGKVLRLGGGYRFHLGQAHAPALATMPEVRFDQQGHIFHGGVQLLLRETATVALTFAQGFRAPNLQEAAMNGDTGKLFHVPNPDLTAERSDTFELLGRVRRGPLTASVATFVSLLDNVIRREEATWQGQSEIGGKPVMRDANGRSGRLAGAEAEASAELMRNLSVAANLAYTRGDEHLPDGRSVPLSFVAPLFGTARVRQSLRPAPGLVGHVETSVRAAAKQDRLSPEDLKDPRIPPGGTPGWWTWNVGAGMTVHEQWRLELAVENLLNRKYKYHASGIWASGTTVVATARASL